MFASQSRAQLITTRMALATASKGALTMSEYFTKKKGLADDMVSVGKKLEDDELISYILSHPYFKNKIGCIKDSYVSQKQSHT